MGKDYIGFVARSSAFIFIASIMANVFGYFARAFLSRTVTPAEFGLFYSVFTFFLFMSLPADMGFSNSLVRYIAKLRSEGDSKNLTSSILMVFIIKLLLALIIGGAMFLLAPWLSVVFFKSPDAVLLVRFASLYILLGAVGNVISAIFNGFKKMYAYGIHVMARKGFFILFLILIASYTSIKGVLLPALAWLLTSLSLVVVFPFLLPVFRLLSKKINLTKKMLKELAFFAFPSVLTGLGDVFIGYIDVMMLTFFRTLTEVGVYNTVLPTALIFTYVAGSVARVMFPVSTELWVKGKKKELKQGLEKVSSFILYLLLPVVVILLFYSRLLLKLLFGDSYISGAIALSILAVGIIFSSMFKLNAVVFNGIGKPQEITKIVFITAVFNTLLNLLLIPKWGIEGAAITTTLSYGLSLVLSFRKMKKYVSWRPNWRSMFKISFSAIVFFMVFFILKQVIQLPILFEAGLVSALSGFVYLGLGYLFKIFTIKDIKQLIPSF